MAREAEDGGGAMRRFFLAAPVDAASPPAFADGEEEHARRVLRLAAGDAVLGVDGAGGLLPCRIVARGGRELGLEQAGPPRHVPAPGEAGAALPHVTLAVAWPKGERGEAMLDRLVQLGAAAVVALVTARTGPGERLREPRLARRAREAMKQCRRAHLTAVEGPIAVAALATRAAGAALVRLEPAAEPSLLDGVARELAPPAAGEPWPRRVVVAVGPEGGFTDEERAVLDAAGARAVRLAPHVLRIETAAEAAMAVLACASASAAGAAGKQ